MDTGTDNPKPNNETDGACCDPNPEPCDCSDIGWSMDGGGDGEQVIGRLWKYAGWGTCCAPDPMKFRHLFRSYYWKRKLSEGVQR